MGGKDKKGGVVGGGEVAGPSGCGAKSCKSTAKRFGFCLEHYDQFKFGLITKGGERVSDYEKKEEHYLKWKAGEAERLKRVA